MPVYAFSCERCGPFELPHPMAQSSEPAPCPTCSENARRRYTPPGIVRTRAGLVRAREAEQKSAHEPAVVGERRGRPLPSPGHAHHPPWVMRH